MNINIRRYATPTTWTGYIEPADRSWIVFIGTDGSAAFFRRGVDGSVL